MEESITEDPILYYAVNLNHNVADDLYESDSPLIFTEKSEALQTVKKNKGARFKVFTNKDEAACFSTQKTSTPISSDKSISLFSFPSDVSAADKEKGNQFKSLTSQETVKLRKAIETGDGDFFTNAVWSNPRYLISSGDTPTILQEGFRYNGLHVAAKKDQSDMCQLILNTIEDDKFLRLLFSDDPEQIFYQRKAYIVDLYLNMPEKGMCETPLHFASKFGFSKVIEILLAHPACDRNRINKNGRTAKECICDRASDLETKKIIEKHFEALYFIPVLRSEGNAIPPIIGQPYSFDNPNLAVDCKELEDPKKPLLIVKAKAGPMPLNIVKEFYKRWKASPLHFDSPTVGLKSCNLSFENSIRLKDSEKGLERLGRKLAKEFQVSWTEYWSFMDAWCDLSTPSGLKILEKHLADIHRKMDEERELSLLSLTENSVSPMSFICRRLNQFHLRSPPQSAENQKQSLSFELNTPESTGRNSYSKNAFAGIATRLFSGSVDAKVGKKRKRSDAELTETSELYEFNNNVINLINKSNIAEKLATYFIDLVIDDGLVQPNFEDLLDMVSASLDILSQSALRDNETVLRIHKNAAEFTCHILKENLNPLERKIVSNKCQEIIKQDLNSSFEEEYGFKSNSPSKPFKMRSAVALSSNRSLFQGHLHCILKNLTNILEDHELVKTRGCFCSWNNNVLKCDSPNKGLSDHSDSSKDTDAISSDEEFHTPPSSRSSSPMEMPDEGVEIFVKGLQPSKADIDVFNAISEVEVDSSRYPYVSLWMHSVRCYPKEVHKMWESPSLMKSRNILQPTSAPSKFYSNPADSSSPLLRFKVPKYGLSTPPNPRAIKLEERVLRFSPDTF